ncbi:hypothetical protein BY458DRAFT_506293 [Sporodiniella umbellata]|nr:hypothetical protein BY458DRAFT_506293 [Sporodiniella umbellata]
MYKAILILMTLPFLLAKITEPRTCSFFLAAGINYLRCIVPEKTKEQCRAEILALEYSKIYIGLPKPIGCTSDWFVALIFQQRLVKLHRTSIQLFDTIFQNCFFVCPYTYTPIFFLLHR